MSTTQIFRLLVLLQLLTFTLLPFSPALAQGPISGFPTPKGETAIAISYSQEVYDTYFLPEDASEQRDIETISYSLFVESGLSDNTSLVLTLPWMRTNDREGSVQDGSIWLKYMNLDNRGERSASRFFTAVGLSLPIGNYESTGIAALGQRATVFQGRLAYQFQHDDGWFLHGQTGIDFQFAPEAQSAWPLLLRTGYGGKFFYTEAWIEFVTALESGTGVQTATAGTGSSWNRVGATLYFPVRPWVGLNFGGAWVLNGTYIGQSSRLNAGLVFKLGAN
ncbi:MAG: transporter [Lewinella sp.]